MTEVEARAKLFNDEMDRISRAYGVNKIGWEIGGMVAAVSLVTMVLLFIINYDAIYANKEMDAQLFSHIQTIPSTEKKLYMVSCVKKHPSTTFKKCMDDWYTNENKERKK